MPRKGLLVVVSGFSGAGKGTLMKKLLSKYNNYCLSISATTREPREGEVDGREYFFISEAEFEDRISKREFIEYARYVQHYYGTPKDYVLDCLGKGKDVLLEIEIQGALKIKNEFPDALLIFVTPPNCAVLKERLVGRGTETDEQVKARLKRAAEESEWMDQYDYLLINDDIDEATEELHRLISSQHNKISCNKEVIKAIQDDMITNFAK